MCVKCKENDLQTKLSRVQRETYLGAGSEFPAENSPFIMQGCRRWEADMRETIVHRHLVANGSIHGLREVFIAMHMWDSLDIIDRYLSFGEPGSWVPNDPTGKSKPQVAEACN